jgi:hypothetical protein
VPENFIEYMHSLAGAAFEYYSCFISYSHEDKLFACESLFLNLVPARLFPQPVQSCPDTKLDSSRDI